MAKSYPIFQLTSKDLTFSFRVDERKYRSIISQRDKNETGETVFNDILNVEMKEDILMYLMEAVRQIKAAPEATSIAAVQATYTDNAYKAQISLTFNKNNNGGYSLTVVENGKGSYEFPIATVAAITFGGVPSKEAERGAFGIEKLRLKLKEAFKIYIDANAVNKGGGNFQQGGYNNKGNQNSYNKYSNSGKGY